jgi:hypothetical protein
MLPVHFDLFLYVMKERNNRLFLLKIKLKAGYFYISMRNKGGRGIQFRDCSSFQWALKRCCAGRLLKQSKCPKERAEGTGKNGFTGSLESSLFRENIPL